MAESARSEASGLRLLLESDRHPQSREFVASWQSSARWGCEMKLSENFTLEELIVTQVRDVENEPSSSVTVSNLRETAKRMEAVRALLGSVPILITSGFRSSLVNKIVGGSPSSAHMSGHAVDFICPRFGSPFEVCKKIAESDLLFDQLIFEETWVHLSFAPRMRREVLTKRRHGTFISGLRGEENQG